MTIDEQMRPECNLKLWRNDPHNTDHNLSFYELTSVTAQDCADALRQNTNCKILRLFGGGRQRPFMEDADLVPFWNAISCSLALERVTMHDCTRDALYSDAYLEAIARSSSIKQIQLDGDTIINVNSLSTFLRATKTVTTLGLIIVKVQEALNPAEAALNLSASIAENTSLETLDCGLLDSFYRDAIFRGLADHTKIKTLILQCCVNLTPQEVEGLRLAVTAKTLVHVQFHNCCLDEIWFSVILQEIRASRSVCQISIFGGCSLDEGSIRLLLELFTTPANKLYSFCYSPTHTVTSSTFLRDLLRSNTCMSEFTLDRSSWMLVDDKAVKAIVSALEANASPVLERLTILTHNHSQFRPLVWCLPKMKHLRMLDLSYNGGGFPVAMLLKVLKRNSSLWQVTGDLGGDLSEAERMKMEFYAKRNKHIHAILEAPHTIVPLRSAWPRVIRAIRGCEMEASIILAALTAALGE
jgi:hypothetical protein